MGIARGADEELKPLNIGLLMFSDDPSVYFRGAQIDLVEYQDDIGDQFRETIFKGPVWQQLKDVLRYIRHSIIKEQIIKIEGKAEADRFYNYPYEALEEAIANAVFHKGYDRQNPIEINIRHDCIEILSFPGPMPPVNNESLKKGRVIARDYRNSRLGDFLKELHLTEGRSTGIPKIRRFMEANGSPEPVFETDADNGYFLTILYPHTNTAIIQDEETTQSLTQSPTQSNSPILKLLSVLQDKTLASGELIQLLNLKHRANFRENYLHPALRNGYIEQTMPEKPNSRLQKYRLTKKGINLLTNP